MKLQPVRVVTLLHSKRKQKVICPETIVAYVFLSGYESNFGLTPTLTTPTLTDFFFFSFPLTKPSLTYIKSNKDEKNVMMARLTIMAALLLFTTWRQSQAAIIGSYRGSRRVCPRILNSRNSRPLSVTTSNVDTAESSQSWLVVGDGDLSYCSTIAQDLAVSNIKLLATVLENEDVHNKVYQRSIENTRTICKFGTVQFGVDATKLEDLYQDKRFDCIEFNFPHWRGKTNAKYNRELVDNFLKSASKVLKRDGKIFIAFCDGQGGMPSESLEKWRQSWMPAMYAASYGLMLRKIDPYDPQYFLSSHRGVDRPFNVGKHPQKYIFSFPNGKSVSQDLQLSCRHELRIVLDPMKFSTSFFCLAIIT